MIKAATGLAHILSFARQWSMVDAILFTFNKLSFVFISVFFKHRMVTFIYLAKYIQPVRGWTEVASFLSPWLRRPFFLFGIPHSFDFFGSSLSLSSVGRWTWLQTSGTAVLRTMPRFQGIIILMHSSIRSWSSCLSALVMTWWPKAELTDRLSRSDLWIACSALRVSWSGDEHWAMLLLTRSLKTFEFQQWPAVDDLGGCSWSPAI